MRESGGGKKTGDRGPACGIGHGAVADAAGECELSNGSAALVLGLGLRRAA